MPTGTIQSVKSQRPWKGTHGEFIDYILDFKNEQSGGVQEVYMTKKPSSPAPTVGESFEFEVVKNDQHGIKVKKVDQGGAGSYGGGSSQAPASNDDRQHSIERQTAAKVAGAILSGSGNSGQFVATAETVHNWIKGSEQANVAAAEQSFGVQSQPAPQDGDDLPF